MTQVAHLHVVPPATSPQAPRRVRDRRHENHLREMYHALMATLDDDPSPEARAVLIATVCEMIATKIRNHTQPFGSFPSPFKSTDERKAEVQLFSTYVLAPIDRLQISTTDKYCVLGRFFRSHLAKPLIAAACRPRPTNPYIIPR